MNYETIFLLIAIIAISIILFIFFKKSKTTQIPVKLMPKLNDGKKDNQVVFIGPNDESPVLLP